MKLFEYLATGKLIVARRLPELEPYESVVSLYDEPEEFVTQVVHALGRNNDEAAQQRRDVAKRNTWTARRCGDPGA